MLTYLLQRILGSICCIFSCKLAASKNKRLISAQVEGDVKYKIFLFVNRTTYKAGLDFRVLIKSRWEVKAIQPVIELLTFLRVCSLRVLVLFGGTS